MIFCATLTCITNSKEKASSKSSKPTEEQTGISTDTDSREPSGEYMMIPRRGSIPYVTVYHQTVNCECRWETTQPRRSARLTSRYKYTVPTDKPIVPSRRLLEREGPKKSFDKYEPIPPDELSKQPHWPNSGSPEVPGPHSLRREYSFVLVDCGTHFEMVSPKTVNHFTRVSECFGTMAPYHNFGSDIGEEELRKKLGAKIVKKDENEETRPTAQKASSASTSRTRKRRRSEDEGDEGGAANDVKRPIKVAKLRSRT